jgi:hypothetical protein
LDKPDSPDWKPVAFDHITLTARAESQTRVVCLTPRVEAQPAIVVGAPSPTDPDPCADLHDASSGVNTVYPPGITDDWKLAQSPWTINVEGLPNGQKVSVEAKAVFGGAAAVGGPLGTMSVRGPAEAEPSFPSLQLAFALPPHDEFWGRSEDHCAAADTLESYLDSADIVLGTPSPCPRTESSSAYSEALVPLRSPRLAAPQGAAATTLGRIRSVAQSHCAAGEPDGVLVWRSAPVAVQGGCVSVQLTGRFARCSSGDPAEDCPTSVRCVPPPTDLVVLVRDTVVRSRNISCVPSYPEPVGYSARFTGIDAATVSFGLRRAPSDGGCFFDLWAFNVETCTP